jgi:hypothetical protein
MHKRQDAQRISVMLRHTRHAIACFVMVQSCSCGIQSGLRNSPTDWPSAVPMSTTVACGQIEGTYQDSGTTDMRQFERYTYTVYTSLSGYLFFGQGISVVPGEIRGNPRADSVKITWSQEQGISVTAIRDNRVVALTLPQDIKATCEFGGLVLSGRWAPAKKEFANPQSDEHQYVLRRLIDGSLQVHEVTISKRVDSSLVLPVPVRERADSWSRFLQFVP